MPTIMLYSNNNDSKMTYQELKNITGIGRHVNRTVINKKGFLPKTSLK